MGSGGAVRYNTNGEQVRRTGKGHTMLGLLVDKDNLTYQLSTRYQLWIVDKDFDLSINQLLIRPSCYQPTVDRGEPVDDS